MKVKSSLMSEVLFYVFILVAIGIIVITQGGLKEDKEQKIVCVHIKGEVVAPGYYEMEHGSRVKDAILTAGGETSDADLTTLNLARVLNDGEELVVSTSIAAKDSSESKLININTADMYTLCRLDGIAEKTAMSIINHRRNSGAFESIDDLKKVEGIGDFKFEKIKDKITVK